MGFASNLIIALDESIVIYKSCCKTTSAINHFLKVKIYWRLVSPSLKFKIYCEGFNFIGN